MLQITSGKLFAKEPERSNPLRGVLYTNLQVYGRDSVETAVGRLLPTSNVLGIQPIIYELAELFEDTPEAGTVVSHGADPYLEEFADIVSFALNVTCTPDRETAIRLTSGKTGPLVSSPQNQLVQRVFDRQVWCRDEDCARLVKIVSGLIGLERKTHLSALKAIRTYTTGVSRIADDFETAYALIVASIESLAQEYDGYRATWSEYEQSKRSRIDHALRDADENTARLVRDAILENEHVSLARRFVSFALGHVSPAFFRAEAAEQSNPVGLSDLRAALPQAYSLRSRYLHNLERLPPLLTVPHSYREVARIDDRLLLTFQGITRLARHVITEFIERQTKVDAEVYDYRRERAGILEVPVAPKYWIWKTEGLAASSGLKRLEGFLEQAADFLLQEDRPPVTGLREMLSKVETMLPNMKSDHRRPFLVLYCLFNELLLPDSPMENFENTRQEYEHDLKKPSLESAVMHLLLGRSPIWPLTEHREVHDTYYFRDKGRANRLKLPAAFEAGISLELAERYRAEGDLCDARELISFAAENYPRRVNLQYLEKGFNPEEPIDWREVVLQTNTRTGEANSGH